MEIAIKNHPVVLITGAGKRRLGFHIAKDLVQRGYRIALHARCESDEQRSILEELKILGDVNFFFADISEESEVNDLLKKVNGFYGALSGCVVAHGVWHEKALEETTAQDLLEQFSINTLGTFLIARGVGMNMSPERGGSIVLISDWAIERPYKNYAAYFVSKGSIPTLTRVLAVELAARSPAIRVNYVAPGPVMVPDSVPEAEQEEIRQHTLLKKLGTPDNIVQAVRHFLENDFITGVGIPVDGGRTISSL